MSGFVAGPGVDMTGGDLPEIAKRLNQLGQQLGKTIYAISGYRTPKHSVEVGGFANDPHTKHEAVDIGVDSMLRSSAGQLTDDELASVGLKRPFAGANEINHVQLADSGGGGIGGALKTVGGGVVGGVVGGVPGAVVGGVVGSGGAGALTDKAAGAAAGAAGDVAKAAVGLVVDAIGEKGARVLLSIALVLAGVALVGFGAARALGLRNPLSKALPALEMAAAPEAAPLIAANAKSKTT